MKVVYIHIFNRWNDVREKRSNQYKGANEIDDNKSTPTCLKSAWEKKCFICIKIEIDTNIYYL